LSPFLLAIWGLGGRGFKITDVRCSLDERKVVRLIGVMPRSYVERGELTGISIKI
jgi:hypothetical protein